MTWLFGEGPDEMQGTDGTVCEAVPTVPFVMPGLTIEKLEGTDPEGAPGSPVCEVFSGAPPDARLPFQGTGGVPGGARKRGTGHGVRPSGGRTPYRTDAGSPDSRLSAVRLV